MRPIRSVPLALLPVGVALLATTAGAVNPSLGLPAIGTAVQLAAHWAAERISPDLVPFLGLVRRLPGFRRLAHAAASRFAFASTVSATTVDLMLEMFEGIQPAALTDLFRQFRSNDRRAALEVLAKVSTLVMVGACDRLTPPRDSEAIAAAVPGADLVVLSDTGHMLPLERGTEVNEWLAVLAEPVQLQDAC